MKIPLTFVFFILCNLLIAQSQRGAKVESTTEPSGVTRALIVGVSHYANFGVDKQLDYADDDAWAFYHLLKDRSDFIKPHNIVALFNEEATDKNKIIGILSTFYKESKAGDKIIVYFAGHGDLQNQFGEDNGFLLLHKASSNGDYYSGDAINITVLNRFVEGAAEKDISVFLITDACRSGKLLSSEENAKRVLSALSQEFDKVMKLVSCQANQVSYEGKQWGDGHGVFSYHFINGLKGLADKNQDHQISFGELSRYVINNVLDDTEDKQEPQKSGNSDYTLISVDKKQLAAVKKEQLNNNSNSNHATVSRGEDNDDFFYGISAESKLLIDEFIQTIEYGKLLSTDGYEEGEILFPEITSLNVEDLRFLEPFNSVITSTCFASKDNAFLIGGDKKILSYDIDTDAPIQEYEHLGCRTLVSDPRGKYFASSGWDQYINQWDLKSGKLVHRFFAHKDDVRVIDYSTNGKWLASGGDDKKLKVWGTGTWTETTGSDMIHEARILDLCFFDLDRKIISVDSEGWMYIWNIENNVLERKLKHSSVIKSIQVSDDAKTLLTGDSKGDVILWDIETFNKKTIIETGLKNIVSLTATQDLHFAIVGIHEGRLLIYNLQEETKIKDLTTNVGINAVVMDPDSKWLSIAMFGGWSCKLILLKEVESEELYANEIFLKLIVNNEIVHLKERLITYYTTALRAKVSPVIDKFITEQTISLKELNEVNRYLNKAIEINRENDLILRRLIIDQKILEAYRLLLQNNFSDYHGAIELLQSVQSEMPDASFTHNAMSFLYRRLNELDSAEQSINYAAKQIPTWSEPKLNLGLTYYKGGYYSKAIQEYDKVLKNKPTHAKALKLKADACKFLGQLDDAKLLYEQSIENEPFTYSTYLAYSDLLIYINDLILSEKMVRRAMEIEPENEEPLIYLAKINRMLYYKSKNKVNKKTLSLITNGFDYLDAAGKLNTTSTNLKLEWAEYYLMLNHYDKDLMSIVGKRFDNWIDQEIKIEAAKRASKYFKESLANDPFLMSSHYGVAYCLMLEGEMDKAFQYLSDLLIEFPDSPELMTYFGDYYQLAGKKGKASKFYVAAIDLNEDYTPAFYKYAKFKGVNSFKLSKPIEEYTFYNSSLYEGLLKGVEYNETLF